MTSPVMTDVVRQYYDDNAHKEWERLAGDRTEFALTMRALAEYLPAPPADVLDIGGGPGRYAIELTRLGYRVTLADIAEAELTVARAKADEAGVALHRVIAADARNLGALEDDSFDAVLMLGPLYHLLDERDRTAAMREALRVLRPRGRFFGAFIMRTAVIRFWAKYEPSMVTRDFARYAGHLESGEVRENVGFTDVYLAHPREVAPFMESRGCRTLDLIGVEGVISMIREKVDQLDGDAWEGWMDLNYRLGKDPSNHGTTEHLLYVGEKS
jgi:ubiquinone/menaquinone biosynthesis C-methylase UbiE